MLKIIGLRGKSRSGKNTLAEHLVKNHGFFELALADPMKRFLMEVFNVSPNLLWGPSNMREVEIGPPLPKMDIVSVQPDGSFTKVSEMDYGNPLTPRRLLQTLGTEWGRSMMKNVWIDYAFRVIEKMANSEGYIYDPLKGVVVHPQGRLNRWKGAIITDVRFDNESIALRDTGNTVVYINRPSSEGISPAGLHASETQVVHMPHERLLINDVGIDAFKAKGAQLLEDVLR